MQLDLRLEAAECNLLGTVLENCCCCCCCCSRCDKGSCEALQGAVSEPLQLLDLWLKAPECTLLLLLRRRTLLRDACWIPGTSRSPLPPLKLLSLLLL